MSRLAHYYSAFNPEKPRFILTECEVNPVVFDAESSVAREALREGGKELVDILIDRGSRRWSQVEVKLAERESDQRQHETNRRREDARQQRQQGGTDGRNGRSSRRRPGVTPAENPGLMKHVKAQIRELLTNYGPIDVSRRDSKSSK